MLSDSTHTLKFPKEESKSISQPLPVKSTPINWWNFIVVCIRSVVVEHLIMHLVKLNTYQIYHLSTKHGRVQNTSH